jgi:MFS family permease
VEEADGRGAESATLSAGSGRLGALRSPNFRYYFASQVITNVGSWMQQVATGWLVLELTNSPAALGFNAVFQALPILVFALIGGVIADRFDRFRLTVGSQIVQTVPDAVLAWLVMSGNIRVEHVFIYSAVSATINGLNTPARNALIPSLVGKGDLMSAMALNSVLWQGSAVIGPALAGWILAVWGLPGSFNINVGSDVVSLIALFMVRVQVAPIARRASSGWNDMREGASYAWHNEGLRVLLITVALLTFFGRPYAQFLPVFARDVFEVGPQGLGLMVTAPALGTIGAGVALAFARNVPLIRTFLLGSAMLGAALVGFCITRNFPLALALLFVVGGCSTGATTLINTKLQELADERLRGRLMSLFMASTWGAWRIGALPLGLAAAAWGAPLAIGVSGAILLAAILPSSRSRALWRTESSASVNSKLPVEEEAKTR